MEKTTELSGVSRDTYAGQAISAVMKKFRGIVGEESVIYNLLDFTSVMLMNNKFASHGIYVTKDNREEAYIKIIETGDETLISDLERYINLLDKIKILEEKVAEVDAILLKLRSLREPNDQQAVNTIIEDYLRR